MKDSRCRMCEERAPGCHGSCPRYADWRAPLLRSYKEKAKDRITLGTLVESQRKKRARWNYSNKY